MGHPHITIVDGNFENRGELYLKHRFDGIELNEDYSQATMAKLFEIWSRPIHLQTTVEGAPALMSFDGSSYRERKLTEETAA